MSKNISRICAFLTSGLLALLPASAFAQSAGASQTAEEIQIADACYSLDQNQDWRSLFDAFAKAYADGKYDEALNYTAQLEDICMRSPILNFSIASTYIKKGQKDIALSYLEAAILNTKEFNVSDEVTKKIWFTRYELENDGKFIETNLHQKEIDANAQELAKTRELANADLQKYKLTLDDEQNKYKTIMYTGIGVGVVGLASLIPGIVLIALDSCKPEVKGGTLKSISKNVYSVEGSKVTATPRYAGYTLIGIGSAAVIAGAIMAGYGGYHLANPVNKDIDVSLSIAPQSIHFGMTF